LVEPLDLGTGLSEGVLGGQLVYPFKQHRGKIIGRYATKTEAELAFIIKDAGMASKCARDLGDRKAECKYLDQVCDAASERYRRSVVQQGRPSATRRSEMPVAA
jgi:hypothetical protein